jgi:cellulose synthase/poly-beta-1,6-N-acetylglucosamine synthase-like glycosyltransferase
MILSISLTLLCVGFIGFHFFGYPLLLWSLARSRPRPVKQAPIEPAVSLIILAYNEETVIADKIKNSLDLKYPRERLEIIVVTDGSEDATPGIVEKFRPEGVTLLHSPERKGKGAAINRGVQAASGDILVFSDANAIYSADTIEKLARNFNDPEVGAVSGRKTVVQTQAAITQSEGFYWRYESAIKRMESLISSTVGVVGEMMSIRRELFRPIPPSVINDDFCLMHTVLRQGYRVIYEPDAVCWEVSAQNMKDENVRRRRINAGRFQVLFRPDLWPWNQPLVLFQLISHKFLRLLLPQFMLGAWLGNLAVLAMPSPPGAMVWLFIAQCLFYGCALLGWLGERKGRRWKIPAIVYYITSGALTSLDGLTRYLTGKQTVLWEKARREPLAG